MEQVVLQKQTETLVDLIQEALSLYPLRVCGEIFFLPYAGQLQPDLLCGNAALPYLPPKDLVFPQSKSCSLSLATQGRGLSVPERPSEKRVFLGIRACDT